METGRVDMGLMRVVAYWKIVVRNFPTACTIFSHIGCRPWYKLWHNIFFLWKASNCAIVARKNTYSDPYRQAEDMDRFCRKKWFSYGMHHFLVSVVSFEDLNRKWRFVYFQKLHNFCKKVTVLFAGVFLTKNPYYSESLAKGHVLMSRYVDGHQATLST